MYGSCSTKKLKLTFKNKKLRLRSSFMINKVTSLSAIALTALLISTGVLAHSGKFLTDGAGNKVLDGNGDCVLAASGSDVCAPPVLAPKPIVAPEPPQRIVQNVSFAGDALFEYNSAVLTDAGKASVDPLIVGSRNVNDFEVALVGHTDSVGKIDYNQKLSERRAQSVADYMISQGVVASAITISGRGETSPAASNTSREGRAKNRRVEASFSGEKITFK
ncbi:MAG: OOP family OmpA-OmpF porin [Pseudohongiellaceae bacterium]|jgi:OOP family OmpA-OmpF porin